MFIVRCFPYKLTLGLINVLEEEVKEIQRRIEVLNVPVQTEKDDQIRRLRFRGHRRLSDHKIVWCDGRDVHQDENDKPVFSDDGTSVIEYLEECEKVKAQKTAARKAAEAKRRRAERPARA